MKFGKYIHDLLLSNETVIIPGFGAFVSEYKPAEITESEVIPPSRKMAFTTSIRNNDGLLVDYVAKEEQVSHFDALKLIEKERDNIAFLLDKGKEVELDNVGRLSTKDNGDIEFVPIDDENLSIETYGLESVLLEKLKEIQEESVDKSSEESVSEIHEEKSANKPVETSETKNDIEEPLSEAEKEQEKIEKSKIAELNVNYANEPVVEPIFTAIREAENAEPEEEKKKKAGWYWYLLILIPIIIAGIFVSKNITEKELEQRNSNDAVIPKNEENNIQVTEKPVATNDTLVTVREESVLSDSIAAQPVEETDLEDSDSTQPIFYLVGGSFELEENARTYMEEIKEKGFDPFFMGKRGKFYMIGVGKYETEGQAFRARQVMWESNPNAGLWILEE